MTAYANLVQDFPGRCLKLLNTLDTSSRCLGLEVTMMLSIASSGLIVPMERLGPNHPSSDKDAFPGASTAINSLLSMRFVKSPLVLNGGASWKYGQSDLGAWGTEPDGWSRVSMDSQDVRQILSVIRNALAHGNIYSKSVGADKQIGEIVFASKKTNRSYLGCGCVKYEEVGMQHVTTTPAAFSHLLRTWLQGLAKT